MHAVGRRGFLPWNAPSLHLVGHCDVCRPHIILPALLPQHAPQHGPTVNSNPHVHVGLGLLSNVPVEGGSSSVHHEQQEVPTQTWGGHGSAVTGITTVENVILHFGGNIKAAAVIPWRQAA